MAGKLHNQGFYKPTTCNKGLIHLLSGKTYEWNPLSHYLPLLWVRHTGKGKWPAGYWLCHHYSNFLDVQVIQEGDMQLLIDGREYIAPAGSAAIIPPGASRLATGPSGICVKKYYAIYGIVFNALQNTLKLDRPAIVPDFITPEFDRIFDQLYQCSVEKNPDTIPEYARLSYSLLLYTGEKNERNVLPDELLRCRQFIEWNIVKPISLDDLCEAAGCGKTTLKELFAKHFGTSPGCYLTQTRLNYACNLMENSSLSIKEIADRCGYRNPLYFSRVFQMHFSCSPREYRRTQS